MEITPLEMTPVKMSAHSHLGESKEVEPVKTFGEYLTDSLKKVNQLELESEKLNEALATGRRGSKGGNRAPINAPVAEPCDGSISRSHAYAGLG